MEIESGGAAERFKLVLRQLSSSRESIQTATKILLDNVDESEELFPILMKRLKKVGIEWAPAIVTYALYGVCLMFRVGIVVVQFIYTWDQSIDCKKVDKAK